MNAFPNEKCDTVAKKLNLIKPNTNTESTSSMGLGFMGTLTFYM